MSTKKYSRLLLKRTNDPYAVPTIPENEYDDHTQRIWKDTDIYKGEFFINLVTERLWVRTERNIKEIQLTDSIKSDKFVKSGRVSNINDLAINNGVDGVVWNKEKSELSVDNIYGSHKVTIRGNPIHTITEDVDLDTDYHTLIVDPSEQEININLPSADLYYGDIFFFRILNYINSINIITIDEDLVYFESYEDSYTIDDYQPHSKFMLQSDGEVWYSI